MKREYLSIIYPYWDFAKFNWNEILLLGRECLMKASFLFHWLIFTTLRENAVLHLFMCSANIFSKVWDFDPKISKKYKCLVVFLGGRSNHLHLDNLYHIILLSSARYFCKHNWFWKMAFAVKVVNTAAVKVSAACRKMRNSVKSSYQSCLLREMVTRIHIYSYLRISWFF